MSFTRTVGAALISTMALAQTTAEIEAYPEYATEFAKSGVTWETVKVKTEDGWNLTLWHLTGNANGPYKVTKPSVLMQHGMGGQALVWTYLMETKSTEKQMAYQLAEDGWDVWLANNRGAQYSQEHDWLNPY